LGTKILQSGRIRKNWAKGTQRKVDQHLRHEILGSKPHKTQQILRSKFEAILGLFFGFSKFMVEITNKSKSVATKSC
jgi:hypothetical protein